MKPQDLDIKRYLKFYKELSIEIYLFDEKKKLANHDSLLAFSLYLRSVKYDYNDKYDKSIEFLRTRANKFTNEMEKALPYKSDLLDEIYWIPEPSEWHSIELTYELYLNSQIDLFKERLSNSALNRETLILSEIERINEIELKFIDEYETGTPIINRYPKDKHINYNERFASYINPLCRDIANVMYSKHLINQIEKPVNPNVNLVWNSNKYKFSHLVKALCLTAFKGNPEQKVFELFASLLIDKSGNSIDFDRYSTDISELQWKEQEYCFTNELDLALREFNIEKLNKVKGK